MSDTGAGSCSPFQQRLSPIAQRLPNGRSQARVLFFFLCQRRNHPRCWKSRSCHRWGRKLCVLLSRVGGYSIFRCVPCVLRASSRRCRVPMRIAWVAGSFVPDGPSNQDVCATHAKEQRDRGCLRSDAARESKHGVSRGVRRKHFPDTKEKEEAPSRGQSDGGTTSRSSRCSFTLDVSRLPGGRRREGPERALLQAATPWLALDTACWASCELPRDALASTPTTVPPRLVRCGSGKRSHICIRCQVCALLSRQFLFTLFISSVRATSTPPKTIVGETFCSRSRVFVEMLIHGKT